MFKKWLRLHSRFSWKYQLRLHLYFRNSFRLRLKSTLTLQILYTTAAAVLLRNRNSHVGGFSSYVRMNEGQQTIYSYRGHVKNGIYGLPSSCSTGGRKERTHAPNCNWLIDKVRVSTRKLAPQPLAQSSGEKRRLPLSTRATPKRVQKRVNEIEAEHRSSLQLLLIVFAKRYCR